VRLAPLFSIFCPFFV